jgi:hypothetical protein
MIGTILTKKLVTSLAYTIIGSEVVRKNLTAENARRVASAGKSMAIRAGSTIKNKAGSLKNAVSERKKEILAAKDELTTKGEVLVIKDDDDDEDSLI